MSPQQSVFPKSHVGFDSITNQIEKKLLKRGFQFNVICVGMLGSLSSMHHSPCALSSYMLWLQSPTTKGTPANHPLSSQAKPVSASPPS